MKAIDNILDKINLPPVRFESKRANTEEICFEESKFDIKLDGEDSLTSLVREAVVGCAVINSSHGIYKYEIIRTHVHSKVWSIVRNFHINLWMLVNKKTDFKRTKFYKDLDNVAHQPHLQEKCLELFMDAMKHGIARSNGPMTTIKPIHQFISLKFQSMVEEACRP